MVISDDIPSSRRIEEPLPSSTRRHHILLAGILATTLVLAYTSLRGDSITYDETSHLTSGMSYLLTGDYRLSPDHPPLAKMWCALPLLLTHQQWPPPETAGWAEANIWEFGRKWLYDYNDGEHLVQIARCMMVALLLSTLLCIYWMANHLFGPAAGLLSAAIAALSSTMLAHGRLVTTDMPVVFCSLLTLIACSRLFERVTLTRLLAASTALAALSLVKFSWLLILPAILLMFAVAAWGENSIAYQLPRFLSTSRAGRFTTRRRKVLVVIALGVFMLLFTWASVWGCYGFRFSSRRDTGPRDDLQRNEAWRNLLTDREGQPAKGPCPAVLRLAWNHRLLPEPYLIGMAFTTKSAQRRASYLMGRYSDFGWPYYFLVAFVIKTELPILVLLVIGLLAARRHFKTTARGKPDVLLVGLAGFTFVYGLYSVNSHLNIGLRHVLPMYPAVFIFAGATAVWLDRRWARSLVAGLLLWLAGENLYIYPHYLAYFNELIGGPRNGSNYLADSNIDWGQDIKRLARWTREHHEPTVKLAYFGSGCPDRYGFACERILGDHDFASPAHLTGGTYVTSLNDLLGVYSAKVRDSYWEDDYFRGQYAKLVEGKIDSKALLMPTPGLARSLPMSRDDPLHYLKCSRLLNRLRRRAPDDRIGYSLFVYRLTDQEVQALIQP